MCVAGADAANLMAGADGDTGEAEVISDADLARLLDRSELQPGDEAYCADELLGEVGPVVFLCILSTELQWQQPRHMVQAPAALPLSIRNELLRMVCWPYDGQCVILQVGQGKVQEMAAQATTTVGAAAPGRGAEDGATTARHAAEEARMLQLLAERAAMLEQAKVRKLTLYFFAATVPVGWMWQHVRCHLQMPCSPELPPVHACPLQLNAAGRGKRARRQINYAAQSPSIAVSGACIANTSLLYMIVLKYPPMQLASPRPQTPPLPAPQTCAWLLRSWLWTH
jgi:hypothetical protein